MTREECARLKIGDTLFYRGFAYVFKVRSITPDCNSPENGDWYKLVAIDNPKHEFCLNAKYSRRLLLDRLRKVEYKKLRSYG